MALRKAEPPFYLVWNEDGEAPRKKHASPELAQQEAERLALAHPGKSFVVLTLTARVTRRSVEIEHFDPDAYIPF